MKIPLHLAFVLFISTTFGATQMTFTKEQDHMGVISITPKNEVDQSCTIVIIHGLGDSAEGFEDVAEHIASKIPYAKFILPTAPMRKVTMNMGMFMPSWYDIVGLDKRSNEFCEGIEESQEKILNILKAEHERGIPYKRMVLAGFSQGGALSLYTGMQLPAEVAAESRLAGIVVMSGYLPHASGFNITPGLEDTPIFHCHGTVDPMVRLPAAKDSQEHVKEKGATNYQLKTYSGLAHSVSPEEISDVITFLLTHLPPSDECKVKVKDPSEMSIKELKAAITKAGLGKNAVGLMEKSEFVELLTKHRVGEF
mmetsp:Transcript_13449/g.28428  ORF Transcript_13449/g.28428 Transcript_13449/m.28428 type:complete len:310 (+) Transcript_13449:32-961(+)